MKNNYYDMLVDHFLKGGATTKDKAISIEGFMLPGQKSPKELEEMILVLTDFHRRKNGKFWYDPKLTKDFFRGYVILLLLGLVAYILFKLYI